MLQCEVPRGHNFLSHVAAALNLDRSGMESARRAAPSPGEALLPTPFPVRELGDTRSWSSSEPRPHQHTRSSSDTLNSSGFLCMPEGGSTCLDTLSRTLTWTYHTFSPVLQHANTYIVQCPQPRLPVPPPSSTWLAPLPRSGLGSSLGATWPPARPILNPAP